ncbi:IS630 family transposase [Paraburkholderia sediminicola]|uniref:IS630 family transposase n=1 Tax=Paraburkholderia sediminicola TaxID=458836 RepID=UPI0038BBC37C
MYADVRHWKRIRSRVLIRGESIRRVAITEGMSRNTVRKIVRYELPPGYRQTRYASGQPVMSSPSEGAQPHVPRHHERPAACPERHPHISGAERSRLRWMNLLYDVERGNLYPPAGFDLLLHATLMQGMASASPAHRCKVLCVLADAAGFSLHEIARHLTISRNSVRKYVEVFRAGGIDALFARRRRACMADDEVLRNALFTLLHEPPSASGINRTSWKLDDLRCVLEKRGHRIGTATISKIVRSAGYRWKSAKVVLTSNDANYEEKLAHIRDILGNLQPDERFFSIDEFGPFAVRMKPGRRLTEPGAQPTVPQWQKSKGCLIITAALELSSNRITHFYSEAKNTDEMMRMARMLLEQYRDARKLYLSWDAASWHLSKKLQAFVDGHNSDSEVSTGTQLELAPLPASAQFLNVIESVFSGMARAIIHNSDYASTDEAKQAVDRYFVERNGYFTTHPKRAGNRIWGMERTPSAFSESNNCKDPAYR